MPLPRHANGSIIAGLPGSTCRPLGNSPKSARQNKSISQRANWPWLCPCCGRRARRQQGACCAVLVSVLLGRRKEQNTLRLLWLEREHFDAGRRAGKRSVSRRRNVPFARRWQRVTASERAVVATDELGRSGGGKSADGSATARRHQSSAMTPPTPSCTGRRKPAGALRPSRMAPSLPSPRTCGRQRRRGTALRPSRVWPRS